jgi:hypothetical protein
MPLAAAAAAIVFEATVLPPAWLAAVLQVAVLGTMAGFVVWSLREAPNADNYAEGEGEEEEYPLRPGAGSLIPPSPAAAEHGADRGRAARERDRAPVPL